MYGVMSDDNGLYYMRARYYSPEIRRFVNQDVLLGFVANGQTLNRYAYVKGRAISSIDPFGLEDVTGSYSEDLLKNYDNTPPLAPVPEIVGILIIAFTPGGGELLDIDALFGMSSPSTGWEKFGAGSSLVLSVLTLGTSPNLGGILRCADEVEPFKNLKEGDRLSDDEIIVLGSNNKAGNFILRLGLDDKPIGSVNQAGKSATIAIDLTLNTEIMRMFGRLPKRGDTLSGAFVEDLRAAGFEVIYAPTERNPGHVRIIANSSDFDEAGRELLEAAIDRIARKRK